MVNPPDPWWSGSHATCHCNAFCRSIKYLRESPIGSPKLTPTPKSAFAEPPVWAAGVGIARAKFGAPANTASATSDAVAPQQIGLVLLPVLAILKSWVLSFIA